MVTAVKNPKGKYPAGTLLAFLHYHVPSRRTRVVIPKPEIIPGKFIKLVKPKAATSYSLPMPGCYRIDNLYPLQGGGKLAALDNGAMSHCHVDSEFDEPTGEEIEALRQARLKKLKEGHIALLSGPTGSDPEMFVIGSDGHVLPAFNFLPAKAAPLMFRERYGDSGLFWDGFQAEFAPRESQCLAYHMDGIRYGMHALLMEARKVDKGAKLTVRSVIDVPEHLLSMAPPEGVILGCSPSKNAYNANKPPDLVDCDPRKLPFRFAGCHMHFSFTGQAKEWQAQAVKMADRLAGIPSVALFRGMEDQRRRKFYGLAGEYRQPTYGIEYRVISSAMLCHPAVTHLMFDLARAGIALANRGFSDEWKGDDEETQACINGLDVDLADKIIDRNREFLKTVIERINGRSDLAFKMMHEGVANILPTEDLEGNWKLSGGWEDHSDIERATFAKFKIPTKAKTNGGTPD